jgi:hypothetical protein
MCFNEMLCKFDQLCVPKPSKFESSWIRSSNLPSARHISTYQHLFHPLIWNSCSCGSHSWSMHRRHLLPGIHYRIKALLGGAARNHHWGNENLRWF